jgi:hypothetical protein
MRALIKWPFKTKTVETSMNTNVLRNKIKLLVPNGNFLDNKTANISIPSKAPPFLREPPLSNPMVTPPTTVIKSESPSIIGVDMVNDRIPINIPRGKINKVEPTILAL